MVSIESTPDHYGGPDTGEQSVPIHFVSPFASAKPLSALFALLAGDRLFAVAQILAAQGLTLSAVVSALPQVAIAVGALAGAWVAWKKAEQERRHKDEFAAQELRHREELHRARVASGAAAATASATGADRAASG